MMLRSVLVMLAASLLLTACVKPRPVPVQSMVGKEGDYEIVPSTSPLLKNVAVGDVADSFAANHKSEGFREHDPFRSFGSALRIGLSRTQLLEEGRKPKFTLNADIRDVAQPSCIMVNCETGSAVEYTLIQESTKRVVWQQLVVVPFTSDFPLMQQQPEDFWEIPAGGALKENIVHVTRLLGQLTTNDLR